MGSIKRVFYEKVCKVCGILKSEKMYRNSAYVTCLLCCDTDRAYQEGRATRLCVRCRRINDSRAGYICRRCDSIATKKKNAYAETHQKRRPSKFTPDFYKEGKYCIGCDSIKDAILFTKKGKWPGTYCKECHNFIRRFSEYKFRETTGVSEYVRRRPSRLGREKERSDKLADAVVRNRLVVSLKRRGILLSAKEIPKDLVEAYRIKVFYKREHKINTSGNIIKDQIK